MVSCMQALLQSDSHSSYHAAALQRPLGGNSEVVGFFAGKESAYLDENKSLYDRGLRALVCDGKDSDKAGEYAGIPRGSYADSGG